MLKLALPAWIRHAAAALGGRHGAVTTRAAQAACRRQTVYDHARRLVAHLTEHDQERDALRTEVARLQAERDAWQQPLHPAVVVGAEALPRCAVVSQARGVRWRQAEELLGTLLPAERVPDQATLSPVDPGRRATGAASAGRARSPGCAGGADAVWGRDLFGGVATRVAVAPTRLALRACAQTGDRSGAAGHTVLAPLAQLAGVVSEAASGIAAGVQAVVSARSGSGSAVPLEHGLDVFPTNQEARRVRAGPWRRAEAAWEEAEAADATVAQSKRHGKDARRAAQPARHAGDQAERLLAAVDHQETAWQRAWAAWAVFRPEGVLNERAGAATAIAAARAELQGPEWKKVRNFLKDWRTLTFWERLHRRLGAAEPDPAWRRAWIRRWWLRHQAPRAEPPPTARAQVQALLDAQVRDGKRTAAEQASSDRVAQVLQTTVRASPAVEGINSVLRMQPGRHRQMPQGLLDRKRLYGNCRALQTGKRRRRCPYDLLGVMLPSTDFWTLLRSVPQPEGEQQAEQVSS